MTMSKRTLVSLATILLLLAAVGCKKEAEVAKTEEGPAPAAGPTAAIDPATAATIKGKVAFEGSAPKPRRIRMDAEATCMGMHKDPVYSEEVVANDNGTLRYVFVYVKEGLGDRTFPTPKEPAILDQKGCMYTPHVSGIQVGQDLHVLNSDPTTHNIHPVPKNNREWNTSMPPGGEKLVRNFPREEVLVPFKCNVHPWMKSYLGVLKHPFFAVTSTQGTFEIKGLPPGEYVIEAWHEKYGTLQQKVTLATKESKAVDFTFKGTGGD